MRILIIEDDKEMSETLREGLQGLYAVDTALTGEDGYYQALTNNYDAIVLDLCLGDTDGITVCRKLRHANIKTPILVLTGQNKADFVVTALDAGSDDYLTKPFNFPELTARLRALTRRSCDQKSSVFSAGNLTLDVSKRTATHGKVKIPLRRKEFELLEYLMRNHGSVITRDMILNHLWADGADTASNIVDVHIKYLRDRVDKPFGTHLIKTVHGFGYKIDD